MKRLPVLLVVFPYEEIANVIDLPYEEIANVIVLPYEEIADVARRHSL